MVPTTVLCPDGVSKHEPSCEPVLKTAQAKPKDLPIKKPVVYAVGLRCSLLILNPRYSTSSIAKRHLSRFTRRFASF